jgi:methionyl-tRNA synthetase
VWFDALLNYVSALGYPRADLFKTFWPAAQHIVAKDILKPHGIYWPIMLKAAGIPIYKHLNVHGYWNVEENKMSKSLGNVIEPLELKNVYGLDAFRFFLIRDMAFGLDSNFNQVSLVQRINSDLANDLGNLFSRVLSMVHKYFEGIVPDVEPALEAECDLGLESDARSTIAEYEEFMECFQFHNALRSIWKFISKMNKYVDVTAPWELAKKKSNRKSLEVVLYNLLEGLRIISGLIYPVMPDTAAKMQKHLGLDPRKPFYLLDQLKAWKTLRPGIQLPKSIVLFPRVDSVVKLTHASVKSEAATGQPAIKPEITLAEFEKIDFRVATVVHAERIPRAKKILKLEVDLGQKRLIIAGIAQNYTPEELLGKQVIVVANLKPAKLMGFVSKGMLIAAVDDSGPILATLDKPVSPGTPLQ